jgi:hypothetical protein
MPEPIVLPRRAKGARPAFFKDPAIDQMYAVVIALTQELSVAIDRLDTVERLLDEKGVLSRADIETYREDGAVAEERNARRDDYIGRVFQILHEEAEIIQAGRG